MHMDRNNSDGDQFTFNLGPNSLLCDFATFRFDEHPHWKYYHKCRRCGTRRYSRTRTYVRECNHKKLEKCPHLGEKIRTENCESCNGNVMLKVLGCAVHGECCVGPKTVGQVRTCQKCPDHPSRTKSTTNSQTHHGSAESTSTAEPHTTQQQSGTEQEQHAD